MDSGSSNAKRCDFMAGIANYIVRVYRFEQKRSRGVVGTVEAVGVEGKRAFTNVDELWEILKPSAYALSRKKGSSGTGKGARRG